MLPCPHLVYSNFLSLTSDFSPFFASISVLFNLPTRLKRRYDMWKFYFRKKVTESNAALEQCPYKTCSCYRVSVDNNSARYRDKVSKRSVGILIIISCKSQGLFVSIQYWDRYVTFYSDLGRTKECGTFISNGKVENTSIFTCPRIHVTDT